jgi:glycosyltransferase involved in cell wall biosynthesis
MKVAFDHQIFSMQEYGGISRYFCELAARLKMMPDMDVRVIAPIYLNRYLREQEFTGICPFGIRLPQRRGTARIARTLSEPFVRRALSTSAPDIVHETYYSRKRLAQPSAKVVITVYDMIHEKFSSFFRKGDPTPDLKKAAVMRADHVICISHNTRKDLLDLIDVNPQKVSVVHLGHTVRAAKGSEQRRILEAPYILFVGQREGYKNFRNFVAAYASSERLKKEFKVVCFGGGSWRASEVELFNQLGLAGDQVRLISGTDDHLASAYMHAHAYICPSLYEGFGIPPLEAMSFGCPVICSSTGSLPEVVGEAAEFFDPTSIESIAAAMTGVLYSTERTGELIRLGRDRFQKFSWARCAEQTREIYFSL